MSEGIGESAARRILACVVFGTLAGGAIFVLESVDRLRVLRHNLYGPGEALRLVLLTAAGIILVTAGAAVFALLWVAADALRACDP